MNNKNYIALAAFLAASTTYTFGQNMADGVRFGSTDISGTARYRSMAGAFGALGGDISCISDNPAGLAIFRGTNTITITPHLGFSSTETLGSEKATGKDNNFSVSNFGAVFSFMPENEGSLVNFNLGFSIERRQQTFRKMNMVLDNPSGSFGGYLFEQANNYLDADRIYIDRYVSEHGLSGRAAYLDSNDAWDNYNAPILTLMGYESFALNDNPKDPNHVDNPIFDNVYQQSNLLERTRHDYYNISGALNFNDILYAGVTVRITDFNSMVEHCFTEDSQKDMNGDYITYDNRIETKGSGIGVNFGLLWKPTEEWRLGAAVHTPVYMNMKEFSDASMEAYNIMYEQALQQNPGLENYSGVNSSTKYDYSTPWEYQFSTAYVFGGRAIASLEYDLRDFNSMRYRNPKDGSYSDKIFFDEMNDTMKPHLKMQHTIKAGLEYRINPQWSARLGYAYKSSPYKKDALFTDVNPEDIADLYRTSTKPNYTTLDDQHYITGGFGWRSKHWSIDLACVSHHISEYYSAYPCDFSDSDILDFNTHQINWDLTLGYRF